MPYLPGEEPPSILNTATKGGLNPDMRTLPPDYNEWLKANGLEPVEMDYTADDQWVYQQLASEGPVEPCLQTKGSKTIGKDGSDLRSRRTCTSSGQCFDEDYVLGSNAKV